MKKALIRILSWLVALVLLGALLTSYFLMKGQARYSSVPSRTHINIKHSGNSSELLPEEVIIKSLPFDIKDSTSQAINTEEVEYTLMDKIPFIKKVDAYVSPASRRLNIDIVGKKPILRYFDAHGSYFLDEEGYPLSTKGGVAVYLPVVKVVNDSEEIQNEVLLPLAHFFQKNEEWYSFFGLIEVVSTHEVRFYPRVGDYVFETIGVENLEEDLKKIELFYKKIVPQVGANKYQLVKLSYDNQIVCKTR